MKRVWQITPDPNGVYDHVVVDSADAAARLAARGAELLWDDGADEGRSPTEPGPVVTICCFEMSQEEFDELWD